MLAPSNFFGPKKIRCLQLNTIRLNLLHLMFLLGLKKDYENANKVGIKAYQLNTDALKGPKEQYYSC